MDDISQKLAELLNDPESLNRMREMAENILGGENSEKSNTQNQTPASDLTSAFGESGFDPSQIAKIISVISRIKNTASDNRSNLLMALKPMLSPPRREKVDTAIKFLKLIDMLPLLRESGLFDM